MRFSHIDWNSDATWFLLATVIATIILAVALERYAHRKKRSRKVSERLGDIID